MFESVLDFPTKGDGVGLLSTNEYSDIGLWMSCGFEMALFRINLRSRV